MIELNINVMNVITRVQSGTMLRHISLLFMKELYKSMTNVNTRVLVYMFVGSECLQAKVTETVRADDSKCLEMSTLKFWTGYTCLEERW